MIPLPSPTSIASKIPLPSVPKVKFKPVKVNVKTGKGNPGGFSVQSIKSPVAEAAKYSAAVATLAAQLATLSSLSLSNPLLAGALAPIKAKIQGTMKKYQTKMANIKKYAPDFHNPLSIPKLPSPPPINVPSLPPLPTIPSLPAATIPPVPTVPSVPTKPNLPTI